MTDRLLIIADTYRLALDYASVHDLGHPGERWLYVYEPWQVQGMSAAGRYVVVTRGNVKNMEDVENMERRRQVIEHLRCKGFTEVTK